MDNWMRRWFEICDVVAGWSKDRSTKVGACIVDERQNLIALGWNGFARGCDDDASYRHERPMKYLWTVHAEKNALLNALASGANVRECTLYTTVFPCGQCAAAAIQAGIARIVSPWPDQAISSLADAYVQVPIMLGEAGIIHQKVSSR